MSTQRDQPTNSQPPNDPMGFGGEKREPGYGKYHPTDEPTDEHAMGVPGAFGDSAKHEEQDRGVAKGDQVNEEMGYGRPSDAPGNREATNGPHSQSQADRLPHSGKPQE
jgi:hypothetical protein